MLNHPHHIHPLHRFQALPPTGIDPAAALTLRRGTLADYRALARFHYRPNRPATIVHILTIADASEPIAALIISMPTLNAPWRPIAWPDLFGSSRRDNALAANRLIRTISRLIVDPRWRGLGIARSLIRTYLAHPLTPCTETLSAMSHASPLFAAAGMNAIPIPPARHNTRLMHRLTRKRLQPHQLLDPRVQQHLADDPALQNALRTWARASSAHRATANGPFSELARRAASALSSPRLAWVHSK